MIYGTVKSLLKKTVLNLFESFSTFAYFKTFDTSISVTNPLSSLAPNEARIGKGFVAVDLNLLIFAPSCSSFATPISFKI